MPVQSCNINNGPGFKWGDEGVCYPYEPGNEESMQAARDKASEQGRAIEAQMKKKNSMAFLKETDDMIIRNIYPADMFVPDSFEAMDFNLDITLIIGQPKDQHLVQQLINPEKMIVQSVKFKKPPWTLDEALMWLKENQKHFSAPSKIKKYAADLKAINNVEIFSAGKWNGDEYTNDDLDEMVKAFEENKKGMQPYLKLGHDEKQALLQKDGMPAAGWIDKIFRKGDKLYANFVDIPKKIFELIQNKAYRKVSSEIFWNIEIAGKKYRRMLAAVSLLGADTPGVQNLSDILANYSQKKLDLKSYKDKDLNIKKYFMEDKQMPKSEKEILLEKELQDQKKVADEQAEQLKKFTAEKEEKEKEIEELKKFKADQEEINAKLAIEKKQAEIKAFIAELKGEKLCSPSMESLVTELLDEDKKEYTVSVNKEDKKLTKYELVKEILKLHSKAFSVNFDENSDEGEKESKDLESKIEAYATENKVDYSTAYRAVLNELNEVVEDDSEDDQ